MTSNTVTEDGQQIPNRSPFGWLPKSLREYVGFVLAVLASLIAYVIVRIDDRAGATGTVLSFVALALPIIVVASSRLWHSYRSRHRRRWLVRQGAKRAEETVTIRFPLQPLQEAHPDIFMRPDKADEELMRLLDVSPAPVLYLTGKSGTGKSSLLNAFVIPRLRDSHPRVHAAVVRSYGDLTTELVKTLARPGLIWDRPPTMDTDARGLLERAVKHLKSDRLLLVFDQFEELLILQDADRQATQLSLLRDLNARPVHHLTVLLVLRSDYMNAIHATDLPHMHDGFNWMEIGGFSRRSAAEFLRHGGLELPSTLESRVLDEAAGVEENRGLFRPITLNIAGRALDSLAGKEVPRRKRGRLIVGWISDVISEELVRDHASQILRQMITLGGSKRPRTEADIASATHLDPKEVGGCLTHLGRTGLIRCVDRDTWTWEISHDFVARLLTHILGVIRTQSWLRKNLVAVIVIVTWFAGLGVVVKLRTNVVKDLLDDGFSVIGTTEEGFAVGGKAKLREDDIRRFWKRINRLDHVTKLRLDRSQVKVLAFPSRHSTLSRLTSLDFWANDDLTTIVGLENLSSLEHLVVRDNDSLTELGDLARLTNLQELSIKENSALPTLNGLSMLTRLSSLSVRYNDSLGDIDFGNVHSLTKLDIQGNRSLRYLHGLAQLTKLDSLQLDDNDSLEDLESLASLSELRSLIIGANAKLHTVDLTGLVDLKSLSVWGNSSLREIRGLDTLTGLESCEFLDNTLLKIPPGAEEILNRCSETDRARD